MAATVHNANDLDISWIIESTPNPDFKYGATTDIASYARLAVHHDQHHLVNGTAQVVSLSSGVISEVSNNELSHMQLAANEWNVAGDIPNIDVSVGHFSGTLSGGATTIIGKGAFAGKSVVLFQKSNTLFGPEASFARGTWGYSVTMHEIGHAFGLYHGLGKEPLKGIEVTARIGRINFA